MIGRFLAFLSLVVALVGGERTAYAAAKMCAPRTAIREALTRREGCDMAKDEDSAAIKRALWERAKKMYEAALRDPRVSDADKQQIEAGLRVTRLNLHVADRSGRISQGCATAQDQIEATVEALARELLQLHRGGPHPTAHAAGNILSAVLVALAEGDAEALKQPHAWALAYIRPLGTAVDFQPLGTSIAEFFNPLVLWVEQFPRSLAANNLALLLAIEVHARAPWLDPEGSRTLRVAGLAEAAVKAARAAGGHDRRAVAENLCEAVVKIALEEAEFSPRAIGAKLKFLDQRTKRTVTKKPRRG